jgi:acetyl-CoA carboxylase carboxyltransferase component
MTEVRAPMRGTVVDVVAQVGDRVAAGRTVLMLESMKMHHAVEAPFDCVVESLHATIGDVVDDGVVVARVSAVDASDIGTYAAAKTDPKAIRADLVNVVARHAVGMDDARPDAVARRRSKGLGTARENLAALCDPESFVEYGALVIAAQRRRRPLEDLIARTPADGLVGGVATVNADRFGSDRSRIVAISYDDTVLAGTQGTQNHRKKDRLFELALAQSLPTVFFVEGGGGRPGDTDQMGVSGLDCMAFHLFGQLSGAVPTIGIVAGRCFAGNAALAGMCDIVIGVRGANLGMGGPAMIEGGGLGVVSPDDIGPIAEQAANGVVDVLCDTEHEAAIVARQLLGYVQGAYRADAAHADPLALRNAIGEDRLRTYDVRSLMTTLFDTDSMTELGARHGLSMVTAFARLDGRPVGVIANDNRQLGGAIDATAAEKASRFLTLCERYRLPVVSLVDTPGIMVGPEAERTGLVRKAGSMFGVASRLTVPLVAVVLRKCYGLGAQAMCGGSLKVPALTVSWPTGEFGGMGLEGAVRLGYRKELAAIDDPAERAQTEADMIARMYEIGSALNVASHFEIDDVIDPADTRRVLLSAIPQHL